MNLNDSWPRFQGHNILRRQSYMYTTYNGWLTGSRKGLSKRLHAQSVVVRQFSHWYHPTKLKNNVRKMLIVKKSDSYRLQQTATDADQIWYRCTGQGGQRLGNFKRDRPSSGNRGSDDCGEARFLSRVSTPWYIAILSVCLSVTFRYQLKTA